MAASSDSNDASDIFWPGYVDAISNLAINLLFVIAVMAIVVIGATLQINELLKRKDRALADDVAYTSMETKNTLKGSGKSEPKSSTNAESQVQKAYSAGTTDKVSESPNAGEGALKSSAGQNQQRTTVTDPKQGTPSTASVAQSQTQAQSQAQSQAQAQAQSQQKDEQIKELQKQLQQVQQQLRSAMSQLSEAQAAQGKAQSASGSSPKKAEGPVGNEAETGRVELVTAADPNSSPDGKNASQTLQEGVIVNFLPNVVQLTPQESRSVVEKMATFAPVAGSKWRIRAVYPNGFSEAKRMAFQRILIVRNVLLQNGVRNEDIDARALGSDQPSADNTRVIIRLDK